MLRIKISLIPIDHCLLNWDQMSVISVCGKRAKNQFIIKEKIKYFCQLMVCP